MVLVYFKSKAFDEESKSAIEDLVAFMEGKKANQPQQPRFNAQIDHRPEPLPQPSTAADSSPKLIQQQSPNSAAAVSD